MSRTGIVTLITDFGLEDPYVGQLKGALLSENSDIRIIDITHNISPHDIGAAAFTLATSYRFFPAGTVHLVVVDPGVGTQRKVLAAQCNDQYCIAPDNGILSVVREEGMLGAIRRISSPVAEEVSATFHGRDIMAPVAARLAGGGNFTSLGPEIIPEHCVFKDFGRVVKAGGSIAGEILRIDHFGNIRTSIRQADLVDLRRAGEAVTIIVGGETIDRITKSYGDSATGELCALIDSDGFLEIAVNQGSAVCKIRVCLGDPVQVVAGSRD